ncbi:antigen 5 like allergen Cul n 1 [Drosophila sulfurigaster albostrigata]|uniref:antigen 5 like allergen Cul n 1 n=1 Tax=Drosophila sulfurigaster albostrigata TaxID=89887 RepID=UPI002D21977A|nr:antigen 5 like allergen Cul n 1 [Drosophila sulfurigaster albostrigata]
MQSIDICLWAITLLLLSLRQVYGQNATTNYCQTDLCPLLKKHIACRNNGELSRLCPPNAQLLNISEYQQLILMQHNEQRHLLAAGKVPNLPQPDKMATLQWSDELEQLATLSVKQCALIYDVCHNTREFRNSGQNLALQNISTAVEVTDEELLKSNIQRWWDQSKNITQDQVESYPKDVKISDSIRNFAVLARDNNTFVGCAAIKYTKGMLQHFLLACNYASNPVPEYAIYRIKSKGCQKYDRYFPALCKPGEQYRDIEPLEPNKWSK